MTEQTRNITEAVIAQKLDDRIIRIKAENALEFVAKADKHNRTLRTLHHFGSTPEEVQTNKSDPYFSTWFEDARKGDMQAMHSILDHFEPLEVITNLGHNYRCRFGADKTEVILDFRPGTIVPDHNYAADGINVNKRALEKNEYHDSIKAYLYSCILRIAKELTMYFPLSKLTFVVSCADLDMDKKEFNFTAEQVRPFMERDFEEEFVSSVEKLIVA